MNYFDPLRQQYANLSGYSDDQLAELAPHVNSQCAGIEPVAQKGVLRRDLGAGVVQTRQPWGKRQG
ncbi:hypothetical protein C4K68_03950 [Pokkaliibacter plantistimulans]|uniref:Uncharacterized protein n=1 Tax=Proteobacteria bacterium 228 TaxID=2083153 RepID=A0A2S5KUX7_9PROT|nr:hypothetical protein C4K68_03950 [Pokkaliibacter plantistimulans]